jgi:hypothetical protein
MSRFKQGEYEYLAKMLRERGNIPRELLDILCEIFQKDNPKFKPDLFRKECTEPPHDLAQNLDHYLYGAPKQYPDADT